MLNYNAGGTTSDIDGAGSGQFNTFHWLKKSIIESRKEQYFMPLASVENMPKHYGKTIKVYEYVPLLDDLNVNDQGLDASGATIVDSFDIRINAGEKVKTFAVEANATAAAAAVNAISVGVAVKSGSGTPWTVTLSRTDVGGATTAQKDALLVHYPTAEVHALSGNLYGSSRDIGTITNKLPTLTENGGRVNRVGFTRIAREGSLHKFGFFYEFTQESMDFDSDDMLKEHLSRELMNGAVQMTEAVLQKDLLAAAGTVLFAGAATSDATITGASAAAVKSLVDYEDLMRLDQTLTDLRCPKHTKVITGSRMVDTKVIAAARMMFVGSELVPHLKGMKDLFQNKAFIEVQHYGDAGTIMNGEIGTIDAFRIILVPEMLHWAGDGAAEGTNPGYRATGGNYDIYPMLVVGDDSFTTIGFQTDGKSVKFSVMTKMPGMETADRNDPYGETGFSSIKWYYGILIKRPERIGLIKTIAPV
jgi:N4-gp56 family major capsid protein